MDDIRFGSRAWWLMMAIIVGGGAGFAVWLGVWSGKIAHCEIGGRTTVILDSRDRQPFISKSHHDRGRPWYLPQALAVVIFGWMGIRFYKWSRHWP